ncbi:MAG: PPC domain-containing protein [Candidatus Lokiarchaeota archaeon]|nr:PPC domain-containing protein [Candidatus Lokiarchaeota archaeon]
MQFRKNMKLGLSFIFLLLIITTSISVIDLSPRSEPFDDSSLSISALEDGYEPNDYYYEAYYLSSNEGMWLSSINGTGTQWDDDWYEVYVDFGEERIYVELTFDHSMGDINLEVYYYDGSLTFLDGNYSIDNNEYIDVNTPWSGTYYIKVYYENNGNSYDLRWEDLSPIITDDNYEENDYDGQAYDLRSHEAWWLSSIDGMGIQWDEDWYIVNLDPGEERIHVELTFDHFMGNIDLEVYYYDGGLTWLDGSYSSDDNEYINADAPFPGTYYIRVCNGNNGNMYDLFWEDLPPSTGDDDWMEENDDFWSAWYVDPSYYPDLKIAGYDEDWFQIYLNEGDTIDISISFDHSEGDLQLKLYDPSYSQRAESLSNYDDEFISFTADMQGNWRIHVYHEYGDSDVKYELDIKLFVLQEDNYEENDFSWDAYSLSPFEGWWLSDISGFGFQSDDDWYEIYAEPGFELLIIKSYNFGEEILLEIYDDSHNKIGGGYSQDDDELMSFNLHSSGTYYIKVYGSNKGYSYDFQYFIMCLLEERTWLSNFYGLGVQGDIDFFYIDVTPGFRHLEVELLFNHIQGNIDMTLYDGEGNLIITSSSLDDNEYIDTFLSYPGIYFLLIQGDNLGNEYDLWWDDVKTDLRSDDAYELNNDLSSAFDLVSKPRISLWDIDGLALQFDEDWYEIYVDDTHLQLIVVVKYDSAEGHMGFDIFDVNQTKITGNFTAHDNDYIDYKLQLAGTYYIKVYGDNTGNVYNLWWGFEELEPIEMIPGYDLLILLGSIIGISVIVIKIKRSKFKHH